MTRLGEAVAGHWAALLFSLGLARSAGLVISKAIGHILVRATSLAVAVAASSVAFSASAQTVLMNAFLPPQHIFNQQILRPWAQDIEKATQGRVKITFNPTSVGSPQQQWYAVRKRIVDGAYIFNGLIQNQVRLPQLAHLPLGSTTSEKMSVALWRTYEKYFQAANEYSEVQLLALFVFPSGEVYSLKEPLQSAESMRGVKLWALPGVPAAVAQAFHAAVVATPAAHMSELVAGGTVDGFMGIPEMDAARFNVIRYAKSETLIPGGITAPSFSLFINRSVWSSISESDREAILKLSGETFARRMAVLDRVNEQSKTDAEQNGLKLLQAAPKLVDQIKAVAAPMDARWIAQANKLNVDGRAALDFYRTQANAEAQ